MLSSMIIYMWSVAEEVVDMRGGSAELTQTYFSKVRPKKKKKRSQPTHKSFPPHQPPFLVDKLHKNPYIARYTLTTLLE